MKADDESVTSIWRCDTCGCIKRCEEEVTCWACGSGEMIGYASGLVLLVWDEENED